MFAQERFNLIKKVVSQHRRMTFIELQGFVNVSPATLRRDLAHLESIGDVIRVHGGVLDPSFVRTEVSFDERSVLNNPAKKAIATAAARLVPTGATVLVDAGTTCLEAGKALLGRKDIRLVTSSIALASAAIHEEASVLCIGGELRKVSGALIGGAALGALNQIHADIAFIGATGIDPIEGCSTTELFEAESKKCMLSRAERKILLADSSKWNNPSTIRFANWNSFSDWIVDQSPPVEHAKRLADGGLIIHQVSFEP